MPGEIVIDNKVYKTDRKGSVWFPHSEHADRYVEACGECHHEYINGRNVWQEGQPVKKCRTCHDPHRMDLDPTTKKFLVMNNSASALCIVCHRQPYWTSSPSTHNTSTKAYTLAQGAHTGYSTVQTNGCETCHKPHAAGSPPRGLKAAEELTCGSTGSQCHSSTAIGRIIEAEFRKTYSHGTYNQTPSSHDASESPANTTYMLPETSPPSARHAECPDWPLRAAQAVILSTYFIAQGLIAMSVGGG